MKSHKDFNKLERKEFRKTMRDLYRASFYTEEQVKELFKSFKAFKYPHTIEEKISRGYSDYYAGL